MSRNATQTPQQEICTLFCYNFITPCNNRYSSVAALLELLKHDIIASRLGPQVSGLCHHVVSAVIDFLDIVNRPVFNMKTLSLSPFQRKSLLTGAQSIELVPISDTRGGWRQESNLQNVLK
jgi:hypothetical protein